MKFPFVISTDQSLRKNWEERLQDENGHIKESIWRRHICKKNEGESGWADGLSRKRLVHVRDRYDFTNQGFCLADTYTWVYLNLPSQELDKYEQFICSNLFHNQDLKTSVKRVGNELEYTIGTYDPIAEIKNTPWKVFDLGIRNKLEKKPAKEAKTLDEIMHFAPFQIELGCGPSIEAGIPALSYFHHIYSTTKNGKFVFNFEDDDLIQNTMLCPEQFYKKATFAHLKCLQAQHTLFYAALKDMLDKGLILEPILTNNFDGLCKSIGIKEKSLYKFDIIYPDIDFVAKSILVIGSHADRRKVREQARAKGLQVIFIDPETYDGITYPVEDTQGEDIILRVTAEEFARQYFK